MLAGLLLALAACTPLGRPIVTEIFYDAIGSDTDLEFVEIANPTAQSWSLAGLVVEAGNGSERGDWSVRWVGAVGDQVPPGARFVIGGPLVRPLPHAVARLSLQNGPDALRIVWPDGVTEVVGYGTHEFGEYFCGAAAPDVAAGQSLSRIPDDARSGSNATDFRAAAPTPGGANQARRDAAWLVGSLAVRPEQPARDALAYLSGRVRNVGRDSIGAGEIELHVATRGEFGAASVTRAPLDAALASGDTLGFELELAGLPIGKQVLEVRLALAGDESPLNDRDSLRVRVGPGPLEITEIQFHPKHAEGEWVEVRNRSGTTLDLSAFTLSDRTATRGRLDGTAAWCAPESLVVFAQHRTALLARYPALDPLRTWGLAPWPALNNTNDASGTADAVIVRETDGTLVARHDYSSAGVPSGVPLELRDGFWWPALDPNGSPLALPGAAEKLARPFVLAPRRVPGGTAALRLAWSLPWARARVAFDLYDLDGGERGRLIPEFTVPGRGEIEHPIALDPGVYVVVLRARSNPGSETIAAPQVLRVEGAPP